MSRIFENDETGKDIRALAPTYGPERTIVSQATQAADRQAQFAVPHPGDRDIIGLSVL